MLVQNFTPGKYYISHNGSVEIHSSVLSWLPIKAHFSKAENVITSKKLERAEMQFQVSEVSVTFSSILIVSKKIV